MKDRYDVIVVGAGHNALVASARLAKAGLEVLVLERAGVLGGAARTERPFGKVPDLSHSTGAYLLGLMQPELLGELGVKLKLLRRDPHYFLPSLEPGRYLLFGSDREEMRRQFLGWFSSADWEAYEALQDEVGKLREDLASAWMREVGTLEEVTQEYVRPELQGVFRDLVRGSVGDYLDRFGFESELLSVMYAVTDGFSGSSGGWDTPGTGHNFLVHNMCRLPGADGTWMFVEGGIGEVSRAFAEAARAHGATMVTDAPVERIECQGGQVKRVHWRGGSAQASVVVAGCDPWSLRGLLDGGGLGEELDAQLDRVDRPGTTFKLNMALKGLPKFTCLPEERGQHGTTMHILPQENVLASVKQAHADAMAGKLPEFPTIEWYIHSGDDAKLRDKEGHYSSALFVQWVPNRPAEGNWSELVEDYSRHLLSICERFAPGASELVVDTFALHPQAVEEYFGMHRGHIHQIDNLFSFEDRFPYALPIEGLYACGAGCHPAGSVIGSAGYIAAGRVLGDLGKDG